MQTFCIDFEDVTDVSETGEFLFESAKKVITSIEANYGVKVTGFVGDAASNCRKCRRLIKAWRPDISILDCLAHMVSKSF